MQAYIREKYAQHRLPAEEADWVGLDLNEACRKQQDIEDNTMPVPEKHILRQQLLARLASGEEPLESVDEDDKPAYQKSLFAGEIGLRPAYAADGGAFEAIETLSAAPFLSVLFWYRRKRLIKVSNEISARGHPDWAAKVCRAEVL